MDMNKQDPVELSPGKLLANFSKGRIVFWLAVAVVIHVVFIGSLSVGYIRDRLDPKGAELRRASIEAAKKRLADKIAADARATNVTASATAGGTNLAASATAGGTNGVKSAAGGTNAVSTASNATETAGSTDVSEVPEPATNSAMMKRLKDVAKPEEMPSLTNASGVSLDDTGVR